MASGPLSPPPPGPGERLKRPGLIGLTVHFYKYKTKQLKHCYDDRAKITLHRIYLFRMFLDHDETRETNVSYAFSNSWTNKRVTSLFTIVGLIIEIVIQLFFTTKLTVFEGTINLAMKDTQNFNDDLALTEITPA